MATSKIVYQGGLRNKATHLASGTEINTDAPIDNQGQGAAFSPTDLLASSLGACMLTIVGIASNTHGFSIEGATCEITKVMGEGPRRVVEIIAKVCLPAEEYTEKQKKIIEKSALTCPVFYSLHADIKKDISFEYL